MLPNLIIIGAGRCGTTSLHYYLGEHPEIFMASKKELMFFPQELNWNRGLAWYESQFPVDAPVRGEASPQYSLWQVYGGVPERMAQVVPQTKLIYLVRDPFERLLSQYALSHSFGHDPRPLAEALASEERGFYVDAGRYWNQLERYLEHFTNEQILVVDADELHRNRQDRLRSVFSFLGVDPEFDSPAFGSVHNKAPKRQGRAPFRLAGGAAQKPCSASSATGACSTEHRVLCIRSSRHRASKTEIDPVVREELEAIYREDAARLREFTGLSLSSWSV